MTAINVTTMFIRLLILVLLSCSNCSKNIEHHNNNQIKYHINKFTTEDAIPIIHVQEDNFPIVSIDLKFKSAGSSYDRINKQGLSKLSTEVIFRNAENIEDYKLKREMDSKSINIGFHSDLDNVRINISTPIENVYESIENLKQILIQKNIREENISIVKDNFYNGLLQIESNPLELAKSELRKIIFSNNKYADTAHISRKSISNINKDDILEFTNNNFRTENLSVTIVGNIDQQTILDLFKNFKLNIDPIKYNAFRTMRLPSKHEKINIIDKDFQQASIAFGQMLEYSKKDKYKFQIINYIIGGKGLNSRFMNEIREKKGLTYGVHTYINNHELKFWTGNLAVNNKNVHNVINIIKSELKKIREHGITIEELERAKSFLINSYILNLDTNSNISCILSKLNFDKLSEDYFTKRIDSIDKISLNEMNDFVRNILDPEDIYFIIVGNESVISSSNRNDL